MRTSACVHGGIIASVNVYIRPSFSIAAALVLAGAVCAPRGDIGVRFLSPAVHAQPAPPYADLVGTYCVTCHNDRLKTAGLSLQALGLTDVPAQAEVWEKVARKLRTGEMPPSTVRSRPDPRIAAALVTHVETTLDRAAVSQPNPGRAPIHRLNRAEYSNAVRDVLAVDVRPGEWLPVDDS